MNVKRRALGVALIAAAVLAATAPAAANNRQHATNAEYAVLGFAPGERLHDLSFRDPAGRPMHLWRLRGRIVVVHLWASACDPCRQAWPHLQRLYDDLRDAPDVAFVVLNSDEDHDVGALWARANGYTVPLSNAHRYTLTDLPRTFLLDRNGIIAAHRRHGDGQPLITSDQIRDLIRTAPPVTASAPASLHELISIFVRENE